mgnify:CR=1 FL=1
MGVQYNIGVTNDGLVFGFDTGIGVNDNDTGSRFYPGEPTAWAMTPPDLNNTKIIQGMSGVSLAYVNTEKDGSVKYSMNGTFSGGSYPYIMRIASCNFTGGTKYSSQAKIKTNVPHKFNYFGTNGISYVNQPMDHGGSLSSVLKDDGYYCVKREGFAYTSTTTQPGYLWTNPINNTSFSSSTDFVWVKDMFIEQKDHCTPPIPWPGSIYHKYYGTQRYAGQSAHGLQASLVDVVGRYGYGSGSSGPRIDVSNVSFNSAGQPEYDGTDDKGVITDFPHVWADSMTMECVVKFEDSGRSIIFGNFDVGSHDVNFEQSGGALRMYWNRGERNIFTASNVVTTNGSSYHHCVIVRDVYNDCFKFYVDGVLINTTANAGTNITFTSNSGFTMPSGHNTFRFGGDTRNGDTIHNGEIPIIRVYNRCLKANEVTRNFKAYKNRFDL